MLEKFSASYRISHAYIEPIDSLEVSGFEGVPRLAENQYSVIAQWYDREGVEGHPIFRIGNTHFPVIGDAGLATDTLKVPHAVIPDDVKVPSVDRYLVMKPSAQKMMSGILNPEQITSDVEY